MARAIKDHHGQIFGANILRFGHGVDVPLHGLVNVDSADCFWANSNLFHVEDCGRVIHGSALCSRNDGDGVGAAFCHQTGTVDWVYGDIHGGTLAGAYLFAVKEHGGLILFALTNDNDAVHRYGIDELAHGVDRRAIALILLAAAYPTAGSECCCLGDTNQFHCQVAVRKIRRIFGHV